MLLLLLGVLALEGSSTIQIKGDCFTGNGGEKRCAERKHSRFLVLSRQMLLQAAAIAATVVENTRQQRHACTLVQHVIAAKDKTFLILCNYYEQFMRLQLG